jgi:hypothetical protein
VTALTPRPSSRRGSASTEPDRPPSDGDDRTTSPPPSFRERGRLRRRLRYLRRARELGYRDLGGLVFDLSRFNRERPDLVHAKIAALESLDRELRKLEVALDDHRSVSVLREPGVAQCAECGALHGSEDRYCPACGTEVPARRQRTPSTARVPPDTA